MRFIRKIHWQDKVYLTFSTLMTTLLGLVLPFSILIIFDRILPNQSTDSLFLLFALILFSIWLDFMFKTQEEKVTSLVMKRFEEQLSNRVFRAICLSRLDKFRSMEMGEYLERISAIPEIKSFFGGESIRAMINTLTSLITIGIIFAINSGAGIALFCASMALLFAASALSRKRMALLEKRSNAEGMTNSKIIEIVTSPTEIKSRTMEHRLENLMGSMINERESQSIDYERLEGTFNLILTLIQQLSVAVVVVLCALAVINLEISQGVMAAVILLTNRYFSPYQQVMQTYSRWKLNALHIERVAQLLDLEVEATNKAKQAQEQMALKDIKITFKQVDIFLKPGLGYQFSGNTGTGKSHVVRCMTMDETDPDVCIFVNGKPIAEIDYSRWKNTIIFINRYSTLVEGSIIDNLTCFRPHLNFAAYSLCENLGIKQHIDQLKSGFFSRIKGNMQQPFPRQVYFALLIIRALLSQKSLLIIDDLDVYFDKGFATRLVNCISTKVERTTCVIISNKLFSIEHRLIPVRFTDAAEREQQVKKLSIEGVL